MKGREGRKGRKGREGMDEREGRKGMNGKEAINQLISACLFWHFLPLKRGPKASRRD